MATLLGLQNRIRSVLLSPEAQRINVCFGAAQVDGAGLALVSLMVLARSAGLAGIEVRVRPGATPGYDPLTKALTFPDAGYGACPEGRYVIVRECVRAVRGVAGRSALTPADEGLAHIAAALFVLHGSSAGRYEAPPWIASDRIADAAFRITAGLLAAGSAAVRPGPVAHLTGMIADHRGPAHTGLPPRRDNSPPPLAYQPAWH